MWIRIVTKEGTVWWQNGDALFIFPPLEITLVSFQTSVRFNITVAVKVSMTLLLRQYLWLPRCMVCEMRWPNYLRQDLKELTFSIIPVSHPSHQVPICRVFFFFFPLWLFMTACCCSWYLFTYGPGGCADGKYDQKDKKLLSCTGHMSPSLES